MTKKSPIFKQGNVMELMTELANLPERKKAPNDPVNLSEVFRTKEYVAEVKAALKKGYTFEDLAEIFTERCGVVISARQIKYHFTRGKNRGMKNKSDKKDRAVGASENHTPSMDSARKTADNDGTRNESAAIFSAKHSSEDEKFVSDKDGAMDANPGAFVIK
jgi:hypothetical protein